VAYYRVAVAYQIRGRELLASRADRSPRFECVAVVPLARYLN
jgi:hypothetical protein